MDRRARCWVFRYCFTLYRDHQSNAFLYSLSRSIILYRPLLLSSCDRRDHTLNFDRCICILILIPTYARPACTNSMDQDVITQHTESQASPQVFFLSFLGYYILVHCGVGFSWVGYFSCSKVALSIFTALAPPGAQGQPASMPSFLRKLMDKQTEITMFSSTAIALYGYDQGK